MNQARFWLTIAGILGAAGVGLGAYGAHGLEQRVVAVVAGSGVSASDELPAEQRKEIARRLDNWKTAAQYQMTHVAALLAIGLAAGRWPSRMWCVAGAAMLLGIAMFSGMLYYEALAPERRLGIVVMFGGISYIAGWLLLAAAAICVARD